MSATVRSVKRDDRGHAMARRQSLNRDKVLDAALALADEEGIEGLSMRRIARSLGVEAMALYNHVDNKNDILDSLAARAFASVHTVDPDLPWPERVRAAALGMYRALRRHPVVPLALVSNQADPTVGFRSLDTLAGAFYEAGLDDAWVRRAVHAVNSLVFGALVTSTAGFAREPRRRTPIENLDVYQRQVDPARLPHVSRLMPALVTDDSERDFEEALGMLIAGLEATARHHAGRPD
ncbi:MAG: TetR/AcrR family transcriptional regulator C-terminal domain-containing protein [Actinocatenispora sp.]